MAIKNGPNTGLFVHALAGEGHYNDITKLFRWLDFFMNPTVKSYAVATPPGSPVDGDTYLVAASPTGAWAGRAQNYARWTTDLAVPAWEFIVPRTGFLVYNLATSAPLRYNGATWA